MKAVPSQTSIRGTANATPADAIMHDAGCRQKKQGKSRMSPVTCLSLGIMGGPRSSRLEPGAGHGQRVHRGVGSISTLGGLGAPRWPLLPVLLTVLPPLTASSTQSEMTMSSTMRWAASLFSSWRLEAAASWARLKSRLLTATEK